HDGKTDSQAQQSQPAQQDSHASRQDSTVQTGGDNSQGVKPSNTTGHDTYATAGSGYTKQYGNGKTAGQIAEQHGAKPDTVLHGPGNSQPHKAALCPGGHERDVHALEGGSGSCARPEQHVEHAVKQVEHEQKQVEHVSSETKSVSHETTLAENEKVYICHATGSSTNPYVLIHVSRHAEWAHTHHQDGRDVVIGSTLASGTTCPSAPAAPTQAVAGEQKTETPAQVCTQQQQVRVAVGVKHFIGPKGSGRFVVIHPSTSSAHYENKHPDEIIWETRTTDVTVPCATGAVGSTAVANTTENTQNTQDTQNTGQAPAVVAAAPTQTPAGGVAGVRAAVPASKPAPAASPSSTGGILGAQATLRPRTSPHGGVLGTVRSTTLPFTGLPLWPVVLGALALIGAGAAVRRTQRGTP
ncbi:MAG TPA: hypothetical protein VLN26_07465, partial [Gaiellaceae bacterium]|nr:hypothetical protein [Gaiellaceae bacterium]